MQPKWNKVNKSLYEMSKIYHNAIPLKEMFGLINTDTCQVVDEAGNPWEGFLCGADGVASFEITNAKRRLQLSWHKMESGRIEVVAYCA